MTFDLNSQTTVKLPIVCAKNFVAIPCSEIRAEFTTTPELKALKEAVLYQNYVVIAYPKQKDIDAPTIGGYYKTGVIAKIIINTAPNNTLNRVKFDAIMRCNILDIDNSDYCLTANVETIPSVVSSREEALATVSLIKKETVITKGISPDDQLIYQKISLVLNRDISLEACSDALASILTNNYDDRLKYVLEFDATKRLFFVLTDLRKAKYFNELETKIDENIRKNMNEAQKEYYLREKMRAIQEELGDKVKKDQDIEEIRERIKNAKLPASVEEKALRELNRYMIMPSTSPESGIIKTYLEFLLSLPWSVSSEDTNDLHLKFVLQD